MFQASSLRCTIYILYARCKQSHHRARIPHWTVLQKLNKGGFAKAQPSVSAHHKASDALTCTGAGNGQRRAIQHGGDTLAWQSHVVCHDAESRANCPEAQSAYHWYFLQPLESTLMMPDFKDINHHCFIHAIMLTD